jgi:hypothetical protein
MFRCRSNKNQVNEIKIETLTLGLKGVRFSPRHHTGSVSPHSGKKSSGIDTDGRRSSAVNPAGHHRLRAGRRLSHPFLLMPAVVAVALRGGAAVVPHH